MIKLAAIIAAVPITKKSHRSTWTSCQNRISHVTESWTLRNSSGVGEGIYKSVVKSDGEFLNVGVGDRQ